MFPQHIHCAITSHMYYYGVNIFIVRLLYPAPEVVVSKFRTQAPWEFLLSASRTTLQSYELSRLAHAANLRKEIGELLDQYFEENTSAMLARWLIEQRERSVLAATDNLEPESAECEKRTVSDNVLADRVPLPRASRSHS
jgi:hypothetical protein